MARSAFLAAFMLSAGVPSVYGTEGGCLVEKYVHITNTADTPIFSLIKLGKPLIFAVKFEDHDLTFWRDWVNLTNSRVTHGEVRDGKSSSTTHDLPLVISEGWNSLQLKAVGARFQLTLLYEDGGEAVIHNRTLDFPVSSVHVEGTFSLCSKGSPEWEVAKGEVVSIPLQSNHTLKVTGRDNAMPYLVKSSSSAKPSENVNTNTNTSLTIETRRRRSFIQVKVYQAGTENNNEPLADMEQPLDSPIVEMGCRAGTLHLRLDLSTPPDPPTPPATKDCPYADSSGNSKALWPMGFGGMVVGFLLGLMVALLASRIQARRDKTSGAAAPPSECEKKNKCFRSSLSVHTEKAALPERKKLVSQYVHP